MKLTQTWVGYLDRAYEQIKRSVILRLPPEVTDHSESNPLIVILSFISGIGEGINLMLDRKAREVYIGTAIKFESAVRLGNLMDYQPKAKVASSADAKFTLTNTGGDAIAYEAGTIVIPAGFVIQDLGQINFVLQNTVKIIAGQTIAFGKLVQRTLQEDITLGTSDGSAKQKFSLPDDYCHNTLKVSIGDAIYYPFISLGQMDSLTKGFFVSVDEQGKVFLNFGDGINGMIPDNLDDVIGTYYITEGKAGNLPPNSITNIITTLVLPAGYALQVTNPEYSSGGTEVEDRDTIKDLAPRSLRTLDRAVSEADHEDIALQVGGVGNAKTEYDKGKFLNLYIAPNTKGPATLFLIEEVKRYVNERKMVCSFIDYRASGISKLWVKGTVYGQPLYSEVEVQLQVADALDKKYGYATTSINRRLAVSDIIADIENLTKVDRFELEQVKILPFVRAIESTPNLLNITFDSLPTGTVQYKYTISYNGASFEVYRNTTLVHTMNAGDSFNDGGKVAFTINSGTYVTGNKWQFTAFKSYPEIFPVTLLPIDDFSAPIIDVADFTDNVTPRAIYGDITIVA